MKQTNLQVLDCIINLIECFQQLIKKNGFLESSSLYDVPVKYLCQIYFRWKKYAHNTKR